MRENTRPTADTTIVGGSCERVSHASGSPTIVAFRLFGTQVFTGVPMVILRGSAGIWRGSIFKREKGSASNALPDSQRTAEPTAFPRILTAFAHFSAPVGKEAAVCQKGDLTAKQCVRQRNPSNAYAIIPVCQRQKTKKGATTMENDESVGNGKKRFSIYIPEATIDMAKKWHEADNCGSVSEYVRRAIEFYSGYVASEHNPSYLPRIVISTLKNIIRDSENRQCTQLYRVAVELAVLMNVIAASNGFSGEDVRKLRESCEEQVKRINGTIRLDDAVRWQNS